MDAEIQSRTLSQALSHEPAGRELSDRERRIAIKNKFTDDGRPATLAELGDARRELSSEERIKLDKHPFDVWEDIVERYSQQGFDSIDPDDMVRFK